MCSVAVKRPLTGLLSKSLVRHPKRGTMQAHRPHMAIRSSFCVRCARQRTVGWSLTAKTAFQPGPMDLVAHAFKHWFPGRQGSTDTGKHGWTGPLILDRHEAHDHILLAMQGLASRNRALCQHPFCRSCPPGRTCVYTFPDSSCGFWNKLHWQGMF